MGEAHEQISSPDFKLEDILALLVEKKHRVTITEGARTILGVPRKITHVDQIGDVLCLGTDIGHKPDVGGVQVFQGEQVETYPNWNVRIDRITAVK